ncbi:hypothetical protein [Candidatus Uabimicrobium amorphum]|uniref:Uncharacterized protein n=1 Tax=Uabimicrobium amorphum TaxID=2596890 RepID=A0A5S9III0_UABAM|nr:hypothetical protein [Candidatus Uabimicrobium amorphum]BBM82197.1 hypothetical protein UABAM_00540 [Candidatus Uabimicrobium amorphum]
MKKFCIFVLCLSCIAADEKDILGGYTQVAVNDAYVADVIPTVCDLFCKTHEGYVFVKAQKAGYQIVAGTNYYFALQFRHNKEKVIVKLYAHKTLDGKTSIVKIISIDKSVLGGYEALSKDSSEAKNIIATVTSKLEKHGYFVESTHAIGKQIVAGTVYCMEMQLSYHSLKLPYKVYAYKKLNGDVSITKIEGHVSDMDSLGKIMKNSCIKARETAMSSGKMQYIEIACSKNTCKVNTSKVMYIVSHITKIKPEEILVVYSFDEKGNVLLVGGKLEDGSYSPTRTHEKAHVVFIGKKQRCLFSVDPKGKKIQYKIESN